MITIRNYKKAESLEEAWRLNQQKSNRIIGGMLWLKMGKGTVQTAIDLSGLSLDQIEETEGEIRIGCMVSLRQLELHAGLDAYTGGAMKEALRHIVGVQFRNLATAGGSIFGRFGFSDVLTMFLAMDSYVELYKGGIVPMREFAGGGFDRDVLVRILVRKLPASFHYSNSQKKHRRNQQFRISSIDQTINAGRLVHINAADQHFPHRCPKEEKGQPMLIGNLVFPVKSFDKGNAFAGTPPNSPVKNAKA